MQERKTTASKLSISRSGWWCGWLCSLLLAMALLVSMQVMAHPEPALPLPVAIAADSAAHADLPEPQPHCEHGHGWQQGAELLPRAERLDIDGTAFYHSAPSESPPSSLSSIGLPCAAPSLARLPLYLLTQRLRP